MRAHGVLLVPGTGTGTGILVCVAQTRPTPLVRLSLKPSKYDSCAHHQYDFVGNRQSTASHSPTLEPTYALETYYAHHTHVCTNCRSRERCGRGGGEGDGGRSGRSEQY